MYVDVYTIYICIDTHTYTYRHTIFFKSCVMLSCSGISTIIWRQILVLIFGFITLRTFPLTLKQKVLYLYLMSTLVSYRNSGKQNLNKSKQKTLPFFIERHLVFFIFFSWINIWWLKLVLSPSSKTVLKLLESFAIISYCLRKSLFSFWLLMELSTFKDTKSGH